MDVNEDSDAVPVSAALDAPDGGGHDAAVPVRGAVLVSLRPSLRDLPAHAPDQCHQRWSVQISELVQFVHKKSLFKHDI